jgi:hypothetical protein
MHKITGFCSIIHNSIFLNGEKIYQEDASLAFSEFSMLAYRHASLTYPRFFKMDPLCKLAFLAAETLLSGTQLTEVAASERTAIVFANRSSSLDTDRTYAGSIRDKSNYFPSPGLFVYTLPNIMIGEISIRHQLKGENAFFVTPGYDADLLCSYTGELLDEGAADACLAGWVELGEYGYEAFLYLVARSSGSDKNSNFNSHSKSDLDRLRALSAGK